MAEKREVCTCTKCGNEAEMTVSCAWVDVEEKPGVSVRKQEETRTCPECGAEAKKILNLETLADKL